jgi:hypothetical protein
MWLKKSQPNGTVDLSLSITNQVPNELKAKLLFYKGFPAQNREEPARKAGRRVILARLV